MELVYLYIPKYKGISNLELHFSNKRRFKFNDDKTAADVVPVENYIPDFFAHNISNLMALVGRNGVGKTTILRYIMQYLADGNSDVPEKGIVIFEDEEKLYYKSESEIQFNGLNKTPEKVDDLVEFKHATQLVYASTFLDPTAVYSDDYSKQQLGISKNLSTNFLLFNDVRQRKIFQDTETAKLSYEDRFNAFASYELIRIVKLFQWYDQLPDSNNKIVTTKPAFLNLKLYFHDDSPNSKSLLEIRESFQSYFSRHLKGAENVGNTFLLFAFEAAMFHLIDSGEFVHPESIGSSFFGITDIVRRYLETEEIDDGQSLLEILDHIIETVRVNDRLKVSQKQLNSIRSFLKSIDNIISQNNEAKFGNNVLAIPISSSDSTTVNELLEAYYSVDRIGDFAEFYFSHTAGSESSFSSGEYSFLTLLARLNSFLPETASPSLLFLIDEAELALHPRWQIEFMQRFTDFVDLRFPNANVQVILTSHSPFILSDLPPHCVTLMDRKNGRITIRDTMEKGVHTFGGNVHELFTDSFFLDDGLMGEFSRKKIRKLIEEVNLEQRQITPNIYNEKYRKRVDIIGEPFLHRKILELISEKATPSTLDRIIADRSSEIETLKELRRRKGNDQA